MCLILSVSAKWLVEKGGWFQQSRDWQKEWSRKYVEWDVKSAWYSFLVKAQIAQINSLFKRAFKYGYVKSVITVEELRESYDDQLFHKASYSNHCLHHLLPVAKSVNYALRDVGHGLLIDHVTSELRKRTFINRVLFSNCYWVSAY